MKIVRVSNFDLDDYPELLILTNVHDAKKGAAAVKAMNACLDVQSEHYFRLAEDDYVLQKGFEP